MVDSAAIYCRISQDRTGAALGVGRQDHLCRRLADSKGWTVAEVYVDNDTSAYSGKPRPAYERMLDDLRAGRRDAVVVLDQDRLTRRPAELEEFIALAEAHGIALANVGGDLDLSTSDGRLRARIMGAVDRQESERKSERIRRERDERAAKGLPHPGPRAFGFAPGNVDHDPVEARLLADAARRVVAGETLGTIAREWNDAGVRTARGNRWSVGAVCDVLTSPRTAGLRRHRGEVVGPGCWEPIVERSTWELLVATAEGRRRPGRPPVALLSGLLVCGRCGAGMVKSGGRRDDVYRCQRQPTRREADPCGGISIVAGPADTWVGEAAVEALADGGVARFVDACRPTLDAGPVVDEITDLEARLNRLADDFADGQVSRAMFLRTSTRLEESIQRARGRLDRQRSTAALAGTPSDAEGLAVWWRGQPVERLRAVLDVLLVRIEVSPADPSGPRRFDARRIGGGMVWRV